MNETNRLGILVGTATAFGVIGIAYGGIIAPPITSAQAEQQARDREAENDAMEVFRNNGPGWVEANEDREELSREAELVARSFEGF